MKSAARYSAAFLLLLTVFSFTRGPQAGTRDYSACINLTSPAMSDPGTVPLPPPPPPPPTQH